MLQFNNNEQISFAFIKMKDREISLMEDPVPDNLQWAPSFSGGPSSYMPFIPNRIFSTVKFLILFVLVAGCSSGVNAINQSSGGWLESCINDSEVHISCDEMSASGLSDDQVDISEFCNIPPEMETDTMQESLTPHSRIFRGRKSVMRSPTKLATSIAYPFALIKPCGVQGDVTLKDINQRIRTPPPGPKDNKGGYMKSSARVIADSIANLSDKCFENPLTKRMKDALIQLSKGVQKGPAANLIPVLFGEKPPSIGIKAISFSPFNKNLDGSQKYAISKALNSRDVFLLHGPPGTGKTTTVLEIILQEVKWGSKILACAASNIAVDNIVERLFSYRVKLVRLGHPARLLPQVLGSALDAQILFQTMAIPG